MSVIIVSKLKNRRKFMVYQTFLRVKTFMYSAPLELLSEITKEGTLFSVAESSCAEWRLGRSSTENSRQGSTVVRLSHGKCTNDSKLLYKPH